MQSRIEFSVVLPNDWLCFGPTAEKSLYPRSQPAALEALRAVDAELAVEDIEGFVVSEAVRQPCCRP
jgi:hypothetical protein